jgi:hypothetical protein
VPGSFELVVWFLCTLLELLVVVCAIARGVFRRYLALNMYMLACALVSVGRYKILSSHGFTSPEYLYFYYYSDLLLTIGLYCALMSLYAHVFEEMNAERLVKLGALLLLLGTAAFSFMVVEQASNRIVTRFVVELSQNLYFVGLLLTYVLWAAILKLRETRTRLIQIVLSLGVYLSLFAADYALRNLYPSQRSLLTFLVPMIGLFLPLTWAYAFWRLPEEARMAPARLAVAPR